MPIGIRETAIAIDDQLSRFMPLLPLVGLSLGFFFPDVLIHVRSWTPWLISLMIVSGALRLRIAEFGSAMSNPFSILFFLVFTRMFMPLFILFASSMFFRGEPDTITGYVLIFATPTAASGFIWIATFQGNRALGLSLILLDTVLSPLTMPLTVSILRGGNVTIDTVSIMISMLHMVVIPTIIGVTLNETSKGKIPAQISPFFNPIAKICMPLVIASNAASILPTIHFNDLRILKIAGICILFTTTAMTLARLFTFLIRFDHERCVTMAFCSQRNTSVTVAIATSFFPEAVALPSLISILFQQLLTGLVGKILFRKGAGKQTV